MHTRTIVSYIEKNMNSKIGVQRAMLVDTNKMIIVMMLRMTPIKRAIKSKDEKGRMTLTIRTLKGIKKEKFSSL
jgi:hypothetical protein